MKRLLKEIFYIPKHEKIREKTMTARVISTAVSMVLCLAVMSITAYAYFTHNVSSSSSSIKTARFDAAVNVENLAEQSLVVVTEATPQICTVKLQGGKTYKISLSYEGSATTGYYKITSSHDEQLNLHTAQLGNNGQTNTQQLTFYIQLEGNKTATFTFSANWGTSNKYGSPAENEDYIVAEETVILNVGTEESEQKTDTQDNTEQNSDPEQPADTQVIPADTEETPTETEELQTETNQE